MLALASTLLFLVAFILHWAGKGTAPWDYSGFLALGGLALAAHFVSDWLPGRRRTPPS